jgi:bifunctional non-homologous end joining protein LigD
MFMLPMLCTSSTPASGRPGYNFEQLMATRQWIADVKIDGVRALAHWNGEAARLSNRHGVDITYRYPEVVEALTDVLTRDGVAPVIIDGEIVAQSGSFEATLQRDQQVTAAAVARVMAQVPVSFVAFDLASHPGTWLERRDELEDIAHEWPSPLLRTTVTSESLDFLAQTRELGLEGVVVKRKSALYHPGTRSKQWIKFRNRYKVTCLTAGYETGNGSRSEIGAIHLALLDDGKPVTVGRVGTGFTPAQLSQLKKALDAREILAIEIECTNKTSGGQLRFPVYRGVRTDVGLLDCDIAQLEFLPTC